ncbi:MAG: F0F1 ATP synthase subunit B family protein, partial [Methyloceanibacter sp.]
EEEAKSILEQAKRESEALAAETRKSLTESVERRTRLAEDKIARAEAQALAEVRASAVDSAIAAAEKILKSRTTGKTASALIETSIRDLEGKLN